MYDIFALSDRAVDDAAALDPLLATYSGIAGHDHAWPDMSPDGHDQRREFYAALRESALACALPDDDRHQLAQRVLIDDCEMHVGQHDMNGHHFDMNNIACVHQDLRFVYGSMADESPADWDAIIERVATVGNVLRGYQQTLEAGCDANNVVSRRQVHAILEQGASAAGDNSSFHSLRQKLRDAPVDSVPYVEPLDAAITSAKQAFGDFNSFLESAYLPSAAAADAVGEDRYSQAAEQFLGTRLDLHETYRWGWDEVERLWSEMERACAKIDADIPALEVLHNLSTKPEYAAKDIDDFITQMQDRQHHALKSLEGVHFDVPPQIRNIDVQVEPAGGALAAHYVGPSEDFSRPGSVWYPVDGRDHFPLFAEITTAYHEGFPGHHLQVGVQNALRDELSRYHRSLVWYPGSGEGWALYAEQLMGELGYLERPEYVVGLLSSQLMRSARVAIDIGLHLELPIPDDVGFHPGEVWTFELAHELMTTRAFLQEEEATSEILRYLGWPGQAISYKVGEQAILDLREDWRSAGNFDPKRFHSTVLNVGSVGLDLLREQVTAKRPD